MFAKGISILTSSAVDAGNIPAPRPSDLIADRCAQEALRSMQAGDRFMSLSQRLQDPDGYALLQKKRRDRLESFLWIDPNQQALECMQDLIVQICEESAWSASEPFDDPARPAIDVQAAETGALFAWMLRRHGVRLAEISPRIQSLMLGEVRRRLINPLLAHDDYPFMRGRGRRPALVMSDLLLCCALMEKSPARRQQPVKLLLRLLDTICAAPSDPLASVEDRIADACAIADLARLMKRLTRGEFDLTRSLPPRGWTDDLIISWICGGCFVNPAGESLRPQISGMDLYRLGYFIRDASLCALGAQLCRANDAPSCSVSGRVLSMEYMRSVQDESAHPPRIRRAAAENGSIMLSRVDGLFAAIACVGKRANAGDIALFADSTPILADAGGVAHSLPLIDGCMPVTRPRSLPPTDADFGADRDLMSVDLTSLYPEKCMLSAYQRTLMTLRTDGTVRLVDAFEFIRPAQEITFRFICAQKPLSLRDVVRIGPITLSWDGDMMPEITQLPTSEALPDGSWLLSFTLRNVSGRLICGFTFERA